MIRETKDNKNMIYRFRSKIADSIRDEISGRRVNTYCHKAWEMVFIWYSGQVFLCCQSGHSSLGNINTHTLGYIWNRSKVIRTLRWMSLNGMLPCFADCEFLSHQEKEPLASCLVPQCRYPRVVQIALGAFCNVNCIMCHMDHRSKRMLDNAVLKRHIRWQEVDTVILSGGEILAMKSAQEFFIWLTEEAGKRVHFITNGLLINDAWALRLVKGSDVLEISVNAATKRTHERINRGSNFAKVIGNINRVIKLKQSCNERVEIRYHFTIVPENIREIGRAILLADKLGCDAFAFSYDKPVKNFLRQNKRLRWQVKNELSRLFKNGDLKIKIRTCQLEYLGLLPHIHSDNLVYNF